MWKLYNRGPDFVGVGVQKSGTTWAGEILAQHPKVLIQKKEISFFIHHFHRGYDWYEKWFQGRGDGVAGEFSVNYIYSPRPESARKEFYPNWNPRRKLLFWRNNPSVRDELKKHYPKVKILAFFRNPVQRAWSHYWFWRNRRERNHKRIVSFQQMFEEDGRWLRLQGHYADQLSFWRRSFPDIGVFLFDDIRERPHDLAKELFEFVGVDPEFNPVFPGAVNPGRYPSMPVDMQENVIEYYREQVLSFAARIGRDLDHWLTIKNRVDQDLSRGFHVPDSVVKQ